MSKNKTQTKKEIVEKEKNKKLEVSLSFVENMSQDIDDVANVPTGFLGIPSIRELAGKAINMTRTPEAVASRLARDLTETDPRKLEEILTRLQTARNNLQQQRLRSGRNIGIGTGVLGQQIGLATGRGASE